MGLLRKINSSHGSTNFVSKIAKGKQQERLVDESKERKYEQKLMENISDERKGIP